MFDQNDIEGDFRMGHVPVMFPFLWIVNVKCKVNNVPIPAIDTYRYILAEKHYFYHI